MPKGKLELGKGKRQAVIRKFKLGGRKSTRSATQTSNDDLRKIVNGKGHGKDVHKARMELERRGAELVIETATEE